MQGTHKHSPGAKADLGVEEVDHRKSKAGRPQPVAHGGERYINQRLAVAHVGWVSALSHLAPLWPPREDEREQLPHQPTAPQSRVEQLPTSSPCSRETLDLAICKLS